MTLNVILVTYNHSKFIQDSLRGILFQKTNFDFDIIVADDYSTDDTLAQIREVEAKSTISFRYLSSERNLGISQNYRRAFEACDAKYVAVLEGDDFWTTPDRLQKHVDFLEHHYECAMSYNRFIRVTLKRPDMSFFLRWIAVKSTISLPQEMSLAIISLGTSLAAYIGNLRLIRYQKRCSTLQLMTGSQISWSAKPA